MKIKIRDKDYIIWSLPRPRKPYYKGGFPLHLEKKLIRELGLNENDKKKILHPFGGKAEFGIRVDINPEVKPDVVGDAHNLPFENNKFELVILDPPYTDNLSKKLYQTSKIKYKKYTSEAVRVCKSGGFIAVYHWVWTPRLPKTKYHKIIVVLPGQWHRARVCCVFQKI